MKQSKRQMAGSGEALPAGAVGETLIARPGSAVTPGASAQDVNKTIVSITLSPGIWAVSGVVTLNPNAATGLKFIYAGISLSNNALDAANANNVVGNDLASTSTAFRYVTTPTRIFNVTSNTVVHLVAGIEYTSLGGATYTTNSSIQAVRIA